jgi:DNA-binding response OmpR family regulator
MSEATLLEAESLLTAPPSNDEEYIPTILIVDDNPVNCKVLISNLEAAGNYKLLVAMNGTKAVQIAEKRLPDLILLDINLPEMNGFEVCTHLKANPETAEIPIIFLSALNDVDSKVNGFNVGGVDYITKPFYKEEVLKRVETQLKIKLLNQSLQRKNEVLAQKNDEINATKKELEASHDQITQSINYAMRIQMALLPSTSEIYKSLPKFFVLYKPRDIVSGDFYWHGEVNNKIILAAVDCTGHGVPGALMSVIGYTQLNNIILERGITSAQHILQLLDVQVRRLLSQQDNGGLEDSSQDGMDISLAVIDVNEKYIEYAGANQPLYIVRQGQIGEVQPDKYPIGGSQYADKQFESKFIKLEPGDTVYLNSDGYPDQFGGELGRKLSRRRFKELLVEATAFDVVDQRDFLKRKFDDWKGQHEQLDDIMVMGFQL